MIVCGCVCIYVSGEPCVVCLCVSASASAIDVYVCALECFVSVSLRWIKEEMSVSLKVDSGLVVIKCRAHRVREIHVNIRKIVC